MNSPYNQYVKFWPVLALFDIQMHRDTEFSSNFPSIHFLDRLLVSSRWSVRIIFEGMETKNKKPLSVVSVVYLT